MQWDPNWRDLCSVHRVRNFIASWVIPWNYVAMVLIYPQNNPYDGHEKMQLPVVQSHYGLFMNDYSRMLRHQKLRQSMENTIQSTFTNHVAFLVRYNRYKQFGGIVHISAGKQSEHNGDGIFFCALHVDRMIRQ